MSVKRFVIKTATKIILFVFLLILISAIGPAIRTVIGNELALAQMQPSNETYILIDTYYGLRPVMNIAYAGVVIWAIVSVVLDVYKFMKNFTSESK